MVDENLVAEWFYLWVPYTVEKIPLPAGVKNIMNMLANRWEVDTATGTPHGIAYILKRWPEADTPWGV